MAFPGASEVDLLIALQRGIADEGGQIGFLARLAGITGARFASLVARPPGSDAPTGIVTATRAGQPASVDADVLAGLLSGHLRPERIYGADELADLAAAEGAKPVRAALDRLGVVAISAMRVGFAGSGSIVLGIFGTRDFGAEDGAVLRRLFPYLQAALRLAVDLRRERFAAAMTERLARRTSLGWLLLDRAGHVVDASADARAWSDGLRIVAGPHGERLVFDARDAEISLMAILDRPATETHGREQAVRISLDPPVHLRITALPDGRQALATLHGEARIAPSQAGLLVDLFGLLPSEARLAIALADGGGLADAAGRLGLTIETARNYSKKIFAKTGTRGQAGLVRLLYASGLAMLDDR